MRKSIACAKHLSSLELAAIDRLAVMEDDDTLVIASTHALPITPPADMDWLIEAALSVPKTFAAPLGCNEAPTCSPVEMWPADTGIFLPFNNSISVEGMRKARTGSLQLRKPAARVDRFASGGLIAGKWATFRHLHKSVGEATRHTWLVPDLPDRKYRLPSAPQRAVLAPWSEMASRRVCGKMA